MLMGLIANVAHSKVNNTLFSTYSEEPKKDKIQRIEAALSSDSEGRLYLLKLRLAELLWNRRSVKLYKESLNSKNREVRMIALCGLTLLEFTKDRKLSLVSRWKQVDQENALPYYLMANREFNADHLEKGFTFMKKGNSRKEACFRTVFSLLRDSLPDRINRKQHFCALAEFSDRMMSLYSVFRALGRNMMRLGRISSGTKMAEARRQTMTLGRHVACGEPLAPVKFMTGLAISLIACNSDEKKTNGAVGIFDSGLNDVRERIKSMYRRIAERVNSRKESKSRYTLHIDLLQKLSQQYTSLWKRNVH